MNISTTIETSKPKSNRGGARPGAGRPKQQHDGETVYELLTRERARHETAKADARETENLRLAGELYERSEVLTVIATAIAVFSEQIRSLPDRLERQAGITPKQAELAEREVNDQLDGLRVRIMQGIANGVPEASLVAALNDMAAGLAKALD